MAGGITAILLLIARIAYGVDISGAALAEIAVYVVLGTATLCSAGIAATTVATDVESASAALPVIAVLLSFVSSIFVPVDQLPGWLAEIGRIFPCTTLRPESRRRSASRETRRCARGNVAVLVAWAVGGVIVAARGFRWEPRATAA